MGSVYNYYRINIESSLKFDCESINSEYSFNKMKNRLFTDSLILLQNKDEELIVFSINIIYKKLEIGDETLYYNEDTCTYFIINDIQEMSLDELTRRVVGKDFNDISIFYEKLIEIKQTDDEYRAKQNLMLLKNGIVFTE